MVNKQAEKVPISGAILSKSLGGGELEPIFTNQIKMTVINEPYSTIKIKIYGRKLIRFCECLNYAALS